MKTNNQHQDMEDLLNRSGYAPISARYYHLYSPKTALQMNSYSPNNAYSQPVSSTDSGLDLLLVQRQELSRANIGLIYAEIEQRRQLRDQNLDSINLDQCYLRNMALLRGEDLWDKYRFKLEEGIIRLESDKRREYQTYFKDLMFLKKDLRLALLEEMEEAQKVLLLNDQSSPFLGEMSRDPAQAAGKQPREMNKYTEVIPWDQYLLPMPGSW